MCRARGTGCPSAFQDGIEEGGRKQQRGIILLTPRLDFCLFHRLNVKTGKLENSYFTVNPKTLSFLGRLTIWVVRTFRLAKVHERGEELEVCWTLASAPTAHPQRTTCANLPPPPLQISNFTIINFVLHVVGPLHEARLATSILVIQVLATGVAFFVRYSLACWLYADHTCLAAAAATPGGTLSS